MGTNQGLNKVKETGMGKWMPVIMIVGFIIVGFMLWQQQKNIAALLNNDGILNNLIQQALNK